MDLVASVKLPSGAIEPCLLKKDSEGHLCKIKFKKKIERFLYEIEKLSLLFSYFNLKKSSVSSSAVKSKLT